MDTSINNKNNSYQKYEVKIIVRDYECDVQGIVNNAVYNNYFEHARNTLIKKLGYSLHQLHKKGEDPVVVRAEIDYKNFLCSGNECVVKTTYTPKGAFKLLFYQELVKAKTHVLCAKAVFTVAVISQGKPLIIKKSIFATIFDYPNTTSK